MLSERSELLYDEQIEIKFSPNKHTYQTRHVDSKDWLYTPSVTSITRMLGGDKVEGLLWWAVSETLKHLDENLVFDDNGQGVLNKTRWEALREKASKARFKTLDKAADIGNLVHEWISNYINWKLGESGKPAIPNNAVILKAVNKFVKWESLAD